MKRFLTIVSALCLCAVMSTNAQAAIYGWTLSKSSTDPLVQTGSPNAGTDNIYLWFYCSDEGMSAAEMTLSSVPPGQVLAFNVMNGFLNAGTATNLLLAVGGCPSSTVVAGSILINHFVPVTVCLGGANVTVDCSPIPDSWPHDHKGYADLSLPSCLNDTPKLCPISVEETSWSTIKSFYR